MATGNVVKRSSSSTGASAGPGKSRGSVEVTLPEEGNLSIRKAENGIIVSIWDSSKEYKDPDHERTFVVDSIKDIVLK